MTISADNLISIDELLSPNRCYQVEGGLRQYKECFMLNVGDGPGRTHIPVSRLKKVTNTSLLSMNISRHDHQVCIITAIRSMLDELDPTKKNAGTVDASMGMAMTAAAHPNDDSFSFAAGGTVPAPEGWSTLDKQLSLPRNEDSFGGARQQLSSGGGGKHQHWGDSTPGSAGANRHSNSSSSRRRGTPSRGGGSSRGGSRGGSGLTQQERKEVDAATQRALASLVHQREGEARRAVSTAELRNRPSDASDVYTSGGGDPSQSSPSRLTASASAYAVEMPRFQIQVANLRSYVKSQLQQACSALQCAAGFIVFCDTRNQRLWWFKDQSVNSRHAPPSSPQSSPNGKRKEGHGGGGRDGPANAMHWSSDPNLVAGGGGVASAVLHSTAPLVIEDTASDARFHAANEPYLQHSGLGSGVQTLLAVPVAPKNSGRGTYDTCAVLIFVNKPAPGFEARSQEERFAMSFADRCASALEEHFFGCLESPIMQEWIAQEAMHHAH